MSLSDLITLTYCGLTAIGVTALLILNRRDRIKNCKHLGGWFYRDFTGKRIKVPREKWIEIATTSFNRVVCKDCGKTLAEINE